MICRHCISSRAVLDIKEGPPAVETIGPFLLFQGVSIFKTPYLFLDVIRCLRDHPPDPDDRHKVHRGYFDAALGIGVGVAGVHDLPVADIERHMPAVADDIAGLGVRHGRDLDAELALGAGSPGQAVAEMAVHRLDIPGTVRAVGQAGAAPLVGIAHDLKREIHHFLPHGVARFRYGKDGRNERRNASWHRG